MLALASRNGAVHGNPFSFDVGKMELVINGLVVKAYSFADDPEMPWFQAKPIVTFLGYTHITNTLEDHVYPEDKSDLRSLIQANGVPIGSDRNMFGAFGYNDLKAIYINESGLYSLILGSRKEQAVEFKYWVTSSVLPAIRRKGFYGATTKSEAGVAILMSTCAEPKPSKLQLLSKSSLQVPRQQAPCRLPLAEPCLQWEKDLGVSRREVSGVKSHFKTLVQIEVEACQIPGKPSLEAWIRFPPTRFKELAQAAVTSYRALLRQRYETIAVGGAAPISRSSGKRLRNQSSEDSDGDDDVLKISEVMRVAGVWRAVWSSFRSDLSNQMLSLKCANTNGSFSDRREETVQGRIPILVHRYKKSCDWPLAWRALQNTRDLYEKRIREFLENMYALAGMPDDRTAQLARAIASSLIISPPS